MKELGPEVARQAEDSQPTQSNPNQFMEQGDLLWRNKRPVRVLRKSTHVSHLTARIPICFVERLEKDKDTDKDVHADRDRTGRPVSGKSFTQHEEIRH